MLMKFNLRANRRQGMITLKDKLQQLIYDNAFVDRVKDNLILTVIRPRVRVLFGRQYMGRTGTETSGEAFLALCSLLWVLLYAWLL